MPMSCKALPTLPPPTMTAGATLVEGAAMVVAMAETLNLEALVVAGDGSIDLVEHGEDVVELHVAREGGEGMIGAAFDVGNFDSAFEDGDDFFKASKAAVDGSEDVEAHGEVEAGLSLNDATLKGPGGPNSEVEDLGGPIARGNSDPRIGETCRYAIVLSCSFS